MQIKSVANMPVSKLSKRSFCLVLIALSQACLSLRASADQLEPRFYPPGSNKLVAYYDPHLDITVTADLNLSFTLPLGEPRTDRNYENAVVYVGSLNDANKQKGYLDVNTWRLPKSSTTDQGCVTPVPGARGIGYFCNESEIGHVFYDEFNGQKQSGLPAAWPFRMTIVNYYWSSTGSGAVIVAGGGGRPSTIQRTRLSFAPYTGYQYGYPEREEGGVWPVTDGDPLARPAVKIFGAVRFSPTDLNTTSTRAERILVENTGDALLTIRAINQSNATEFPLLIDRCSGEVLSPGEKCDVAFNFRPVRDGGRTSNIQIVSDALSSPDTLAASGTGVGVAVETVTPSELHFGLIPTHLTTFESVTASEKTVTLRNSGTSAFHVQSIVSDRADFVVSYETCTAHPISPAGSGGVRTACSFIVKFNPPVAGAVSGHIQINTDSPSSPVTIAVTGTGTEPNLVLSSYVQDFSHQALNTTSTAHTVTATNAGNETLRFSTPTATDVGIRSDSNEFHIINSQCGVFLAPGASCAFDIVFQPVAQGPRSGTVHIAGYGRTVQLSGIGEAVALELLVPNDLHFGEQAVGSSSTPQSVQLGNLGSAGISVTSIVPDNPAFAVEADACSGQVVMPNTTCGFSIRFIPSVSGVQAGHVVVDSDAPSAPDSVAVTGTGTIPALSAAPGQLMFGNQAVGTHALPQTLILTNTGKAGLVISALNSALPEFPLISENCVGHTVASGGACHMVVGFIPGRDGGFSGSVAISSNAPTSPDGVIVSGTGVGTASDMLNPTILHFGSHTLGTTTAPSVVTVTNSGNANLNVASLVSDNTEYSIVNDACTGQSLAPAGTCQFSVQFSVTQLGVQNGHITITSDASNSPDHVALTGTGIAPSVQLSTHSMHFGALPIGVAATPQTVTASNAGSASLSISSIDSDNPEFSFSADTCSSQTLAAGAQCTFDVNFTPTADGAQSALLQFVSNAGSSPDKISAAGNGKRVSSETLSPASLTFPTIIIGHPAVTKQVVLTNTGTGNLAVSGISSASPHYNVVDDQCSGKSIAPQSNCLFRVTFSPTTPGTWVSQVEVHSNGSGSPDLLAVTGTGAFEVPKSGQAPRVPDSIPTTSKWAVITLIMLIALMVFVSAKRQVAYGHPGPTRKGK